MKRKGKKRKDRKIKQKKESKQMKKIRRKSAKIAGVGVCVDAHTRRGVRVCVRADFMALGL